MRAGTAMSDGQYAQTRESYHDEATVTSTWTITSTCADTEDCTGRITTDQGWNADAHYRRGQWHVVRTVDNWERCADGTSAPGQQNYMFHAYPADPSNLTGWDKTIGPSRACGVNQWLTITMPFTLRKLG